MMLVIDEFVRDMVSDDQSVEALGVEIVSATNGAAVARMTVAPTAANGHGICHGGIVYFLADTAFALAANSLMPGTATADASIVYFSPARVGEVLIAEAQVRHTTRRQSLVDVSVRSGERLVAEYRGKGALLPKPPG
ncbi:phenylacetic acid degradation protein PaaD [Micromonospora globispora]|uniref:hotdog fold thioesterase n=1 Tax=Micromonospora globispora TaxID=1450148 RepID=UPI000D6F2700|nr:hotdog fold thioesterase [Micromonospora globispora]PWU55481.1 phenylacetic acid degradation protein PaaD [Micromonospora globispora]RQW98009.1 phenylacetic acid degradation protein PaaD [Micromonospora globispora]